MIALWITVGENLRFRAPARTSRDTLHEKPSWFIRVRDQAGREGWGECSIIPGLSLDQASGIEALFRSLCRHSKFGFGESPGRSARGAFCN